MTGIWKQVRLAFATLAAFGAATAHAGPTLLFEPATGKVLYSEDLDDEWHPASLTKIMTAYLAFEAIKDGTLKLDQKISCSDLAFQQSPSKVGLPVGAEMTVETALQALIVKSANDVAMMLAEAISGNDTAFVALMNNTARRLGMSRTTFVNPNGLPAALQVTTARDLARLARATFADYPQYAYLWGMQEMRYGKIRMGTHNGLLKSFEGADGMKTGFICDSGFNVVASATREGQRLMAVVLGENTGAERTIRAGALLEHGFQNAGWKALFNTTQTIDTMPLAADARSITSMRQSVISWECGTRGRPRTVNLGKGKPKTVSMRVAKAKAEAAAKAAKAKGAAQDATAAPDQAPAAVTPEAKPAPAKAGQGAALKDKLKDKTLNQVASGAPAKAQAPSPSPSPSPVEAKPAAATTAP